MNSIFGIGPLELMFIAVIALVIMGPERLPGTIREGMKHYRTLRNMGGDLTSQFSEELKALDDINPQKIMDEMMQDLDVEEEKKALADLNPNKIRKDISDSVNPKKMFTKKPAADKAVETAVGATAAAGVAAATEDEPAESESVQPQAEDADAVGAPPAGETDGAADAAAEEKAAPVALTTTEILAKSQPKMSGNPYKKSSKEKATAEVVVPESPDASPPQDSKTPDLDESVVENRIAPDELAANIDTAEAPGQTEPASISTNGIQDSSTHDSVEAGA